jgi:hypothetical protein
MPNTDENGKVMENSTFSSKSTCQKCGAVGKTELRNYSMMWHEGDIHCTVCGAFIRVYDAG